jgi:hypothetical protein
MREDSQDIRFTEFIAQAPSGGLDRPAAGIDVHHRVQITNDQQGVAGVGGVVPQVASNVGRHALIPIHRVF